MAEAKPPDTSGDFAVDEAPGAAALVEADPVRLAQRQKQIDYGKNTLGYVNYLKAVPRERRRCKAEGRVPIDPITPDVRQVCSKRAFDGQVKKWRRMLHAYDPPAAPAPQNPPPPAKRRADAGAEGGKLRADAGAEGGKRPRLGPQPADAAARAGKGATAAAGAAADAAPAAPAEAAVDAPAEVQRSIYDAWDEEDVGL